LGAIFPLKLPEVQGNVLLLSANNLNELGGFDENPIYYPRGGGFDVSASCQSYHHRHP
jgi:hypothetical protein